MPAQDDFDAAERAGEKSGGIGTGLSSAAESMGSGMVDVAKFKYEQQQKQQQQQKTYAMIQQLMGNPKSRQKLQQTAQDMKATGALTQQVTPLEDKEYNQQAEQMIRTMSDAQSQKMGASGMSVIGGGSEADKRAKFSALFKASGIPEPQPKVTPVMDLDKLGPTIVPDQGESDDSGNGGENVGWSANMTTGEVTIHGKEEDPVTQELKQERLEQIKTKQDSIKSIADAMQNGDQLADFTGLYGLSGPVKAELEKRGVNVAKLQLQTLGEKRLAQTLNGPQQVRLRQSIKSVQDGLDILDNLNSEFERTGIKGFNKAEIEALANGSGTKEQQQIAQQFKTQIIGLQDEFGNVIMSGNSPTDRALELGGKTFNEDYNDTTIGAATKQMRILLNTRMNAIDSVGASGGGTNPAQATLQAAGMGQSGGNSDISSMSDDQLRKLAGGG
jgi:hypothetical protein